MSGILDIHDIMHSIVQLNKHNIVKNMYSQVCVFFVTEIPGEREKVCFYKHYKHIQYVTCAACQSPRSLMSRSLPDLQPSQWLLIRMCWAAVVVEPEPMTNAATHGQDEGIWTSMLIHLGSFKNERQRNFNESSGCACYNCILCTYVSSKRKRINKQGGKPLSCLK